MTMTVSRRTLLTAASAALVASGARAQNPTPGVTETEIRIGNTMPYSGPVSAYGVIGQLETAYFKMINDQGGIAGRKINFISLDDGYSPPRTVEQVRRLVEQDEVAFLMNTLGTAPNTAIQKYLNQKKIPQLLISTGADKWGDYKNYPWTMGYLPSYRTEAQIYTKYMLRQNPNAKLALLYQNDDFGKDYPAGVRDVLGDKYDRHVVKALTFEVSDTTVDSQIATLKASGADVLLTAALSKFAAMTIRKVFDLDWHPMHFLSNTSISVGSVMEPAGPDKARGIISSAYLKDPTDPAFKEDAGLQEWRGFMARYMPSGDVNDTNLVFAYGIAKTMMQILRQCDGNFSRDNILKQATNLRDFDSGTLLPGVKVNTSPTNYHPIRAMQLQRWNGKAWERFGDVIDGAAL